MASNQGWDDEPSRDVLAGLIRVADSKVDPESCTADLRISLIAK